MANTVITVKELTKYNTFSEGAAYSGLLAAVDSTSLKAEIEFGARDEKCLVMASNSHATDAQLVTIKVGNGIQGVADLSYDIDAGDYVLVALESGAFKNITGDDKGKIIILGESASIKVAAFRLP